jgi:two-component system cell cycle sensor histidine kinase/response regulator CckA
VPAARGGCETILIVEDEAGVREFAAAVLQPSGYRVLQARSGREALEVWSRHRERVDLLLTDMVLPDDLSGHDLATKLIAEKPSLAVVYTSGYFQDTDGRELESADNAAFLHKPYHPRALSSAVRQMLDAREHATGASSAVPLT